MKPGWKGMTGWVSVVILIASPASPQDSESVSAAPLTPPTGFTAEQHTTRIETRGPVSHTRLLVYKAGPLVRFERQDTSPPEITIHDYEKHREYRLYEADHMVFETDLSRVINAKAQREGLIPYPDNARIEVKRFRLGETVWENHPTEIILQVRRLKEGASVTEYTLFWEALDLNRQPLRIAYHQSAQMLIVVEYLNFKPGPVDSTLLTVPEGYMTLTPY
jgi:hypothetical protein